MLLALNSNVLLNVALEMYAINPQSETINRISFICLNKSERNIKVYIF